MLARHPRAIVVAALVCGAAGVAVALTGYDQDLRLLWAIFGPAAGLSFVGTGLYAARRRPESRTGELMVLFGFAWFVSVLGLSDSALLFTVSLVAGGLWGGVFLQLVMAFPSGRLERGWDRRLVVAGYVIFTVATVPAMLVTGPEELGCDGCPANLLLVHRDDGLSSLALGLLAAAYAVLFVIVLVRLALRWRHTPPLERLQLTPVYASGLLTFLLATAAQGGGGDEALLREHRRVDPARELAQLGQARPQLAQRAVEQLGDGGRVGGAAAARVAEQHREPDEPGLRAVVQVALEAPALRVSRLDDPQARRAQIGVEPGDVAAQQAAEERERQQRGDDQRGPARAVAGARLGGRHEQEGQQP